MSHRLFNLQTGRRSQYRLSNLRLIEFELTTTRLRRSRSKEALKSLVDGIRSRRLRILVVDDMHNVGETMREWLANEFGADVTLVDSGRAAIDDVSQNSYNCIFLDLMMPDMDGVETFLNLKNSVKTKCVVMMSADPECPEWEKALQLGLNPIPKPIHKQKEDIAEILHSCQSEIS